MEKLQVGTKVDFYEVVSYKNEVYVLDDGYNKVTIDMEAKKVAFVERNNRCYKAEKFTKSFNFLINSIEELEAEEVEEVENLTDDLFQEEDIAYAEEAIERETNKEECNKMKTNIELRIDVDMEVIEETGYSIEEIKAVILRTPFTNFTINDYTIVTLDNKEQIRLLPYFTAFNTMVISVSYW